MTDSTCASGAAPATAPDPRNPAALAGSLCDRLRSYGVRATRKNLPGGQGAGAVVACAGGGLNQLIALRPDPDRPGMYRWYYLWSDGLRGEGPVTPEPICPGEEIATAITSVARVLGVRPVAH